MTKPNTGESKKGNSNISKWNTGSTLKFNRDDNGEYVDLCSIIQDSIEQSDSGSENQNTLESYENLFGEQNKKCI